MGSTGLVPFGPQVVVTYEARLGEGMHRCRGTLAARPGWPAGRPCTAWIPTHIGLCRYHGGAGLPWSAHPPVEPKRPPGRVRVLRLASVLPAAAELRTWRKDAGLTQRQLTTLAGVPGRAYRHMERGKRPIDPKVLAKIRAALAHR